MTMSLHSARLMPRVQNPMTASLRKSRAAKRDSLNLRIKPEERSLIDRAAAAAGKNRTDFILDAARRAAEEALLDRVLFSVTPEAHAEFLARLAPHHADARALGPCVTLAPPGLLT